MSPPTIQALRALIDHENPSDRAFADAEIRRRHARGPDEATRAELSMLFEALRVAALRHHAEMRSQIASGALRGAALRQIVEKVPLLDRDHFVEELLGIAYPPLDEPTRAPELVHYAPSGLEEILHAFDTCRLGPDDRFLDLGSGMGKVAMLATLLTGAKARGVEHDPALVASAREACTALSLDDVTFDRCDAREASVDQADVVFMYVPFVGSVLADVMTRLAHAMRGRRRFVCCAPLDPARHGWLEPEGAPCGWLQVHASRENLGSKAHG